MADSPNPSTSPLPAITPSAIRNELTDMIVKDLLGPAEAPDEELDQREDRVYGLYLVGMLAPVSARVETEEQDSLHTAEQDDVETGASEAATTPVDVLVTFCKSSS
jgi:hypothetical protein